MCSFTVYFDAFSLLIICYFHVFPYLHLLHAMSCTNFLPLLIFFFLSPLQNCTYGSPETLLEKSQKASSDQNKRTTML